MRYGSVSADTLRTLNQTNRHDAFVEGVRNAHVDRRPNQLDPVRAMRLHAWLEYVGREDADRE